MGWPTDDAELLKQFVGNLEDADASASHVRASAASSQEARERLSRVKNARSYFHAVGVCAFDGHAQPSTGRKLAKSRGKGKTKRTTSPYRDEPSPNLGTLGAKRTPTSRSETRPPMSMKRPTENATTRGVPNHALRLRRDQCMCRQVGHRATECSKKVKASSFSRGQRASRWSSTATTIVSTVTS